MDKELLMIISMTSGGLFGSLGGYKWKWMRRYLLPVIFGSVIWISGFEFYKALIITILFMIGFSLPYGEKTSYPIKFLVAGSWSLITLLLGFTIWQLIAPIVFIILFILSNSKFKWLAEEFSWKICEFIAFSNVGIIISILIAKFQK